MSRRSGTLAAVAAGVVLVPAALTLLSSGSCSLVDLYDGVGDAAGDGQGGATGVSTSSTGTGAPDAGPDAPSPCLDGMVLVTPGSDAGYCIDRYEVTNADYARFLAVEDAGSPLDSGTCHWNTSYVPDASLDAGADLPVLGVNWCDAFDYCKWAGKHLCGSTTGGPISPGDIDGTKSQWFRACSHDDMRNYPYSNAFDVSACVDCDPGAGCHEDGGPPSQGPAPVGSKATCQGGYSGIFDMSGNAAEWEDGCDDKSGYHLDDAGKHVPDSRNDVCYHRGGSFYGSKTALGEACLGCKVGGVIIGGVLTPCVPAADSRSHKALDVGLRCCFDY
jgi:hypothetical protein